jgi:DNA segregation ATPase FtsK/SpoIIIE, S-DNA-T family
LKKPKITKKQIIFQFILITMVGLSICLFLSQFSYNTSDPGWSRTAWHSPISNFGGYLGAYASDIFFQFFGFIAYSLPFIIIFICSQLSVHFYKHANDPVNYFSISFRIIGVLAFIFSSTGFFSLNIRDAEQFGAGGYLGAIVVENLLPLMNNFILSLVLLGICLACVTLLTGLSWINLIEKLGAFVMILLAPIRWLLSSKKTNQTNKTFIKENEEQRITIPLEKENIDSELSTNKKAKFETTAYKNDNTLNNLAMIDPALSETSRSSEEDKELIDTTTELLESCEQSPTHQPLNINTIKKEIDPSEILSRLESIIKNMDSHNVTQTQDQSLSSSIEQIKQIIQHNTSEEKSFSEESEKYKISDAPSKSLFTLSHHESEIKLNNTPVPLEPVEEISAIENELPFIQEENIFNEIIETEEEQEYVDTEALKKANPVIDDIQTLSSFEEGCEDSLIHPLLKRDNKPLPKPTTPLPSLNLLTAPSTTRIEVDHAVLNTMSELIEKSLSDYRVKAKVVDYMPGPVITRFEIELAPGIKAARISTLDRDLARSLSMPSVRVVEVIPGKPYVGIELPNKNRQTVYFREVLDSPQFKNAQSPLTVVLGKDIAGQSVVADLAKMPHLLVAGTTGSGKSVGVNAMILSILYKSQPEDVRFIMIDPKMLELSIYEGIPHLLTQVVTDMKDAANALNWCVNEMERRYRLMSALGVRNIAGYNEKIKQAEEMGRPIPDPLWKPTDSMDLNMPTLEKLPYIVVMVDEFADLIMAVGKKVEELIARLAQKARAAGIHLVLATQRPSVDVITGLIKANIPTRIAFTVSSKIDSRTILDQMGAESLLGMGDMLYLAPNSSIPIRVHGAFVRDEEVHAVVQDWKARGIPKYIENVTVSSDDSDNSGSNMLEEELDPLFDQVVAFVVETRRASISSVQRKFRIGYNRAARIVEQMEVEGIISSPSHNGNREVLATPSHSDY